MICNPPKVPEGYLRRVVIPKDIKDHLVEYLKGSGCRRKTSSGMFPGLPPRTRGTGRYNPRYRFPQSNTETGETAPIKAERYEDALVHYQSYAEALPDVAQPHCLVGDTLSALGRFQDAIDAYTRAIARITRPIDLGPDATGQWEAVGPFMLHTLYYNRGNAHAATGDHAELFRTTTALWSTALG